MVTELVQVFPSQSVAPESVEFNPLLKPDVWTQVRAARADHLEHTKRDLPMTPAASFERQVVVMETAHLL